jgi:DnaJ-domain-containing protein 1
VTGKVIYGEFQGIDLIDLDEAESRRLLRAVANDPDSLSLLETWLDKNRSGWREWLASHPEQQGGDDAPIDDDAQAYEVLGLKPGASAEEIRAAHRKLMMGVHPDQGGSNFLASKINEAKDRLLKKVKS